MLNWFKQRATTSAKLRAALAVVFLIVSSFQPVMLANTNPSGVPAVFDTVFAAQMSSDEHSGHTHDRVAEADTSDVKGHLHGKLKSGDKGCEVHCAPGYTAPVMCQNSDRPVSRCFAPGAFAKLPLGEYAALIRPPRSS